MEEQGAELLLQVSGTTECLDVFACFADAAARDGVERVEVSSAVTLLMAAFGAAVMIFSSGLVLWALCPCFLPSNTRKGRLRLKWF